VRISTRDALCAAASASDSLFRRFTEAGAQTFARELCLPIHFLQQLLAVEDKRFEYHPGVDPISIARALIFNVGVASARRHGASTITQQLYSATARRRRHYQPTVRFKLKQMAWAIGKTFSTSKSDILRKYLETIYFGRSYHGLAAAARGYCQRNAVELSIADSFFLVDRIATPNRASLARIGILSGRPCVSAVLTSDPAVVCELTVLYERHFGCGEAMAKCLEKSLKRSAERTYTSLADALSVPLGVLRQRSMCIRSPRS
jgi:hypothetical protein